MLLTSWWPLEGRRRSSVVGKPLDKLYSCPHGQTVDGLPYLAKDSRTIGMHLRGFSTDYPGYVWFSTTLLLSGQRKVPSFFKMIYEVLKAIIPPKSGNLVVKI